MNEDINVNIKMNYKQILSLATLMIETNNVEQENLLTIRDLAEYGLNLFGDFEEPSIQA